MYRVFISYSSRDRARAIAVRQWLIDHEPGLAGEIFIDVDAQLGIVPGNRWKKELTRAIERCEAVICLISPHWEQSPECGAEFRYSESLNKRIFCARLDLSATGGLAREWQFVDLIGSDGQWHEDGLHRLLRGLREAGIGAENFPWPPPGEPARAPYRGWQPMQEPDAAVFFGRDTQILRAMDILRGLRRTRTEELFVILGPSGAGKSSFMRAGLLPRLRRASQDFLVMGAMRAERAALTGDRGLAAAVYAVRAELGLTDPVPGDLKTLCAHGDTEQLAALLREAQETARIGPVQPPTLVLPIDQAEELFDASAGPEAGALLHLLSALIASDTDLIVLVTIRTDRYESLQTAPELLDIRTREFGDLKPLPSTQFKEIITGPAARSTAAGRPLRLTADLVDALLADAMDGADTLPLLALTLSRLYSDYAAGGQLTSDNYRAMGGIRHIVHHEIDQLLAVDPTERRGQLAILRSAFIPWLATIDPHTDQPLRRVARWSELPAQAHPLIDAFVARRLLVKDVRNGAVVVEVATETLLRQWDRLSSWLSEEAHALSEADTIERAVAAWEHNERDEAWLFEGVRLESALRLSSRPGFESRLGGAAEFLLASRAKTGNRIRAETASRLNAEAHELFSGARTRDDRRAIHLMLAAQALMPSPDPGPLLEALFATSTTDRIITIGTPVVRACVCPFGRYIATLQSAGRGGSLLAVWNLGSGANMFRTEFAYPVTDLAFGMQALFTCEAGIHPETGYVRAWKPETGTAIGEPLHLPRVPHRIALTATGDTLAVVGFRRRDHRVASVQVWNLMSRTPIGSPVTIASHRPVECLAFSPDKRQLLLGGGNPGGWIQFWNASSGQPASPAIDTGGPTYAIAFSSGGARFVSSSHPQDTATRSGKADTIWLWDTHALRPIRDPMQGHTGAVTSVAYDRTGTTIASGGTDGSVRRWDADRQWQIGKPMEGHSGAVTYVSFIGDTRRIVSASADGTVRVWNPRHRSSLGHRLPVKVFDTRLQRTSTQLLRGVSVRQRIVRNAPSVPFALGPDSRYGVAVESDDSPPILFDPANPLAPRRPLPKGRPSMVCLAFSPDGRYVAAGHHEGVRIWDIHARKVRTQSAIRPTDAVFDLAFTPDGNRVISTSQRADSVTLWETATGQYLRVIPGDSAITVVAISPDGSQFAGGYADGSIRRWATDSGSDIGPPIPRHSSEVVDIVYNPNGHRLVSIDRDLLVLWNIEKSAAVATCTAATRESFRKLALSPDGQHLLTLRTSGIVRHDPETTHPLGEPLRVLGSEIGDVVFTRDSRYFVTLDDNALRFWEASTGRSLGEPMRGPDFPIDTIYVSQDNRFIVGEGTNVWLWPAPSSWAQVLSGKVSENMTRREWREWVSPDIEYLPTARDLPVPDS